MTAEDIINKLGLTPHPEGGYYRETWVAPAPDGNRPSGTCIYFLLKAGEHSHWHRVDATEIWHYYVGDPLILSISETADGPANAHCLSSDLATGKPQIIVPTGHWQAAQTTGAFTLVGCTVSPGFQFDGFELAPAGFTIPETPKLIG